MRTTLPRRAAAMPAPRPKIATASARSASRAINSQPKRMSSRTTGIVERIVSSSPATSLASSKSHAPAATIATARLSRISSVMRATIARIISSGTRGKAGGMTIVGKTVAPNADMVAATWMPRTSPCVSSASIMVRAQP
jgi:hypothetical protein